MSDGLELSARMPSRRMAVQTVQYLRRKFYNQIQTSSMGLLSFYKKVDKVNWKSDALLSRPLARLHARIAWRTSFLLFGTQFTGHTQSCGRMIKCQTRGLAETRVEVSACGLTGRLLACAWKDLEMGLAREPAPSSRRPAARLQNSVETTRLACKPAPVGFNWQTSSNSL